MILKKIKLNKKGLVPLEDKRHLMGFTLIETLISFVVFVILLGIVLANYRSAEKNFTLERAAYAFAQNIKRAEIMALSSKKFKKLVSPFEEVTPKGYGIFVSSKPLNNDFYTLFADIINGDCYLNVPFVQETVQKIYLEKGVKIKSIESSVSLNFCDNYPCITFCFEPPDPKVFFKKSSSLEVDTNEIQIIISLIEDPTKTKTIRLNKTGAVSVE